MRKFTDRTLAGRTPASALRTAGIPLGRDRAS